MGNDEADDEASAMSPGLDCWLQQHGAHPGTGKTQSGNRHG